MKDIEDIDNARQEPMESFLNRYRSTGSEIIVETFEAEHKIIKVLVHPLMSHNDKGKYITIKTSRNNRPFPNEVMRFNDEAFKQACEVGGGPLDRNAFRRKYGFVVDDRLDKGNTMLVTHPILPEINFTIPNPARIMNLIVLDAISKKEEWDDERYRDGYNDIMNARNEVRRQLQQAIRIIANHQRETDELRAAVFLRLDEDSNWKKSNQGSVHKKPKNGELDTITFTNTQTGEKITLDMVSVVTASRMKLDTRTVFSGNGNSQELTTGTIEKDGFILFKKEDLNAAATKLGINDDTLIAEMEAPSP